MKTAIIPLYHRLALNVVKGQGVWVWDSEGKCYLDTHAGLGVTVLGHSHPTIVSAIKEQAERILHTSNGITIAEQEGLASRLHALAGTEQAFFCNSGTEATETAIKLARQYGHHQGINNPCILVTEQAYHGRTLAATSASGIRNIQAGFEPLMQGFARAPYNDIDAVKTIAKNNPNVVAMLIEPILGHGGIVFPDDHYLQELKKICDEHHWLLMLDEVQAGMGRTGKLFSFQHQPIQPDVITMAKGLANGIPIGACLIKGSAIGMLKAGSHGSTFGGNPLACKVACTVLDVFKQDNILNNVEKQGRYLLSQLRAQLAHNPLVKDIRGKGLMLAIEFTQPCKGIRQKALDYGLWLNVIANDTIIRLLPPLTITQEECDIMVKGLVDVINQY